MGTYSMTWTTSARQDRGLARLFNRMNADLANAAIAADTIVNAGGSGYKVGDVLTLVDSGTTVRAATFRVSEILADPNAVSGPVKAVNVINHGNYTTHQAQANHQTTVAPAGGTGCVLRVNYFADIAEMCTRNGGILDRASTSYADQFASEIADAVRTAIPAATVGQLNSIAGTLGVTLPD